VTLELVIFDCDGVLVDSEPIANRILTEMLNDLGLDIAFEETLRTFVGRSMSACLQLIEERLGRPVPDDFVETYNVRSFAAFERELRPVPGIHEILGRIRIPVCVASSASHEKMRTTLGVTRLLAYFEGRMFSATEVGRGKPDPALFLHAAERMRVAPRAAAVVEDTVVGVGRRDDDIRLRPDERGPVARRGGSACVRRHDGASDVARFGVDRRDAVSVCCKPLRVEHWEKVRTIFAEGIASGQATFETEAPEWAVWDRGHLLDPRLVAVEADEIVGWAAVSPVSGRCVYGGVAEVSVYVAAAARGRGVGRLLLPELVQASERAGIWTLQAGIFIGNEASIRLHRACGFREVGVRERLGALNGVWRDVLLMERRSRIVGV
jgi:phosphinothricin acetyltransferase